MVRFLWVYVIKVWFPMNDKKKVEKKTDKAAEADVTAQLASALTPQDASLATVRDILFGADIRESEKQRNDLEQQLRVAITNTQKEAAAGREALAVQMQQMRAALDKEIAQNTAEFNHQVHELNETIKALESATSNAEADLNDQIDTNVKRLNTQMENWRDELSTQLDDVNAKLSDDKTDRRSLAKMFAMMSSELSRDDEAK
jgi:hypothetical protein